MTTLIAGYTDETPSSKINAMTAHVRRLLAAICLVTITLSRVPYHPRAIMLAAPPAEVLQPVQVGCREEARTGTGSDGRLRHDPWLPHTALAYGNSARSAVLAIEALGREMPADMVAMKLVSMISRAPRQKWIWELLVEIPLDIGSKPGSPV